MAKFDIECRYCGHKWKDEYFYEPVELTCSKCNDRNLKFTVRDESKSDAFGYNADTKHKDSYIK